MVSTVKIVVDEDFPVAMDIVSLGGEVVQLAQTQRGGSSYEAAEKILQRSCMRIEIDKDQRLPGIDFHGHKAVVFAFEVLEVESVVGGFKGGQSPPLNPPH